MIKYIFILILWFKWLQSIHFLLGQYAYIIYLRVYKMTDTQVYLCACALASCFGMTWLQLCGGMWRLSNTLCVPTVFSRKKRTEQTFRPHLRPSWRTNLFCWSSRTVRVARDVSCNCHRTQNLIIQNFWRVFQGNAIFNCMYLISPREWDPSDREGITRLWHRSWYDNIQKYHVENHR